MRLFGLVLVTLLASCSLGSTTPPPPIRASDYNQSCQQSADCTLINEGSDCCLGCGNAAINKADLSKYQAAAAQRQASCQPTPCPALACIFSMAYCNAGTCAVCHSSGCGAVDGGTTD